MGREIPFPTSVRLREIFTYDPSEPLALRWRNPHRNASVTIGDIAGYWHALHAKSSATRRYVDVDTRRLAAHRVVWCHVKEEPPPRYLGFRDDNESDCRIENLIANPRRMSAEKYREASGNRQSRWRSALSQEEWSNYCRKSALRRAYGITLEDFDRMFAEQDGKCAVCRKAETMTRHGKIETLSVDHCHETNVVRGLLCTNCNNGIGRFGDDAARLRAAADYLDARGRAVAAVEPLDRNVQRKRQRRSKTLVLFQADLFAAAAD